MKMDRRLLLGIAAAGLAMAVWIGITGALIWFTLEPEQRETVGLALGPRLALLGMSWAVALALLAALLRELLRRFANAPARLAEQTRVLLMAVSYTHLTLPTIYSV